MEYLLKYLINQEFFDIYIYNFNIFFLHNFVLKKKMSYGINIYSILIEKKRMIHMNKKNLLKKILVGILLAMMIIPTFATVVIYLLAA